MGSNDRLRVGLIGAGTIAFSAHLPAIQTLRNSIELVAVADIREENAEKAARDFGASAWYSDYRQLLERDDLDFVDICTPEFLHAEQTTAAAEAGLHVLCEKPMAPSLADADEMLDACKRNNVWLMIAHSRRFTPRYQRIREAIDRGEIGEVRYVRENERRPVAMYDQLDVATSYWEPEGGVPWIAMAEFTHGAAMTNAIHETDLARWFVGRQPTSIFAEARKTDDSFATPNMLSYTVTFENGAVAASEIVNQLPRGYQYFHLMEVIGTEGRIRAGDQDMQLLTAAGIHGLNQPANMHVLLHVDQAYVNEIATFARAIRSGQPPELSPHEARDAVELSVAAVLSSQRGLPVTLPLPEGVDLHVSS